MALHPAGGDSPDIEWRRQSRADDRRTTRGGAASSGSAGLRPDLQTPAPHPPSASFATPSAAEAGGPFGQGIAIRCRVEQGVVTALEIDPRRPPRVDRLLAGKSAEAVKPLLGVFFSLCRHAHALASSQALAMALENPLSREDLRRGQMLRDLEIIREHGLNLFQSLPPGEMAPHFTRDLLTAVQALCRLVEIDRNPGGHDLASRLDALQSVLQAIFGAFWTFDDPGLDEVVRWAGRDGSRGARMVHALLRPGWPGFGACTSAVLPVLRPERLERLSGSAAPAFWRTPTWDGVARESSCFSRQAGIRLIVEATRRCGNGLLARTLARMVEMKRLFEGLSQMEISDPIGLLSAGGSQGIGIAQVEASRGRLIHRTVVEAGRVKEYSILAPTEWNFHPAGLVRNALLGASAPTQEELRARIHAWLHAVDPCVHFELSFDAPAGASRNSERA